MNDLETIAVIVGKALYSTKKTSLELDELIIFSLETAKELIAAGYGEFYGSSYDFTKKEKDILVEKLRLKILEQPQPTLLPVDDFLDFYSDDEYYVLEGLIEENNSSEEPVPEEQPPLYSDAELELALETTRPHPDVELSDPEEPVINIPTVTVKPLVKDRGPAPSWATRTVENNE